ncbi:MAG: hypothetical protein Q8O03_00315 [Nanoarchaeota archaeon]|nr:hypothetical protein [Nanoarchaeota archaeon]
MESDETIAPANLIIKDYMSLLDRAKLRMASKYKKLLLIQSITGHAQNGHCEIPRPYVNTTIDEIVNALSQIEDNKVFRDVGEVNKKNVKLLRDGVIETIESPFKKIIEGKDVTSLTDEYGNPLLGISTLLEANIKNKEAFLIGGYLASKMDNYEWRKRAAEDYNIEIGGGECVAINMKNLPDTLTLSDLANNEWGKLIELFIKSKIIVDKEKINSSDYIKNAYIRHKQGKGVSDDTAIIIAGTLYGEEAFWGAYLFDAIDTWDKYATYIFKGGADERFGEELKPHINITDDEVIRFIYLSRKESGFPDSSQRYFLQINEEVNQTALESHLKYLRGQSFKMMELGFKGEEKKVMNVGFYRKLEKRLRKER